MGLSKRREVIEIKLVKDKTIVIDVGHNYGRDDGIYEPHSGIKYVEIDLKGDFFI